MLVAVGSAEGEERTLERPLPWIRGVLATQRPSHLLQTVLLLAARCRGAALNGTEAPGVDVPT